MDTSLLIEIFGYIGSVLVVVSMLMSSVVKLRIFNMIGSVISGIYALISGAIPLMVMNVCLIAINLYNLYKLLKTTKEYDLVESSVEDTFLQYFVERYKEDIKVYFPEFDVNVRDYDTSFLVCCNGTPAGLFLGKKLEDGVVDIGIDYSTPVYRDCSVGTFLYAKLPGHGVKKLQFAQRGAEEHMAYMSKMGFKNDKGIYVKEI